MLPLVYIQFLICPLRFQLFVYLHSRTVKTHHISEVKAHKRMRIHRLKVTHINK